MNLAELRRKAVAHTLFPETTLPSAMARLCFVQADPIRAPARAQDLILRLRVKGYRAGDLERRYPTLNVEEGYLYAYGFMPRWLWHLRRPARPGRLSSLEKKLLVAIERQGAVHPDELAMAFGTERALNAWGGYSKVTKLALERLHARGSLRVARRDKGIRVYELGPPAADRLPPAHVFRELVMAVVQVLAPVPDVTLRSIVTRWAKSLRGVGSPAATIHALIEAGELAAASIDGRRYLWPADGAKSTAQSPSSAGRRRGAEQEETPAAVRLLAPFDPLVWDRRRFEHLWGWTYRFEAYTPVERRIRGYYALPLLWLDRVIGWANLSVNDAAALDVDIGFAERRPRERVFAAALDAELERMRIFLRLS